MDLFEYANQQNDGLKPLAERMRPQTLNEFIGQEHIVGEGSLLRRAIAADRLGSCIFYGPPGTGKTTLANIIAKNTNSHFEILNAVSSGVADAKRVIEEAKNRLMMYGKKTYLLLDECHRWNKAQSDSVLSAIEQGYIVFIGSTTENPYVSMTKAIVSRCRLFEFHSLTDKDVLKALNRAINDKRGLLDMNVVAEESALEHLAWASGGDVRTALNALELAAVTTSASADGAIHITKEIAEQSIQKTRFVDKRRQLLRYVVGVLQVVAWQRQQRGALLGDATYRRRVRSAADFQTYHRSFRRRRRHGKSERAGGRDERTYRL